MPTPIIKHLLRYAQSSITYLLEGLATPTLAYSLRKLNATATLAIRVRRSNDNAELNIGFIGVHLDTTSLLTFVGANSGFVTTWYDQSGNGRNAVQTTVNLQPRIVNAGVLDISNGKPSMDFLGSRWMKYSNVSDMFLGHFLTVSVFSMRSSNVGNGRILSFTGANTTDYSTAGNAAFSRSGSTDAIEVYSVNRRSLKSIVMGQLLQSSIQFGTTTAIRVDGVIGTSSGSSAMTSRDMAIGTSYITGELNGVFSELVVLSDVPADTVRQTLELNQGAYYGITIV